MRFPSFLPDLEVIKAAVRVVLHVKDGEVEQDLLPDGDTEGGGTHVLTMRNLNYNFMVGNVAANVQVLSINS